MVIMATKRNSQKLPTGSYMKKVEVLDYVHDKLHKGTLGWLIPQVTRTYCINDDYFYLADDVKNIMAKDLFREMECNVPTLMIL
jgi:hypothetical protein